MWAGASERRNKLMCKELRGCSAGLSSQEGTSRPTALRLRWERFWGLEAALGFKHSSIGAGGAWGSLLQGFRQLLSMGCWRC